jgi:CBS domain-containing protein
MDGTHPAYYPLATATMGTSVFDVVHMFSERGISAVPILDADGVVQNLYETVDVIVRGLPAAASPLRMTDRVTDAGATRCLPLARPDHRGGARPALA